jgi:phosphomannomutase
MYKTGHSLIKARMKEVDSPLGGEMSGHIFFKERWFGFDDGTYAGCRLLEIVSRAPDANQCSTLAHQPLHARAQCVLCRGRTRPRGGKAVALADFPAPAKLNTIDGLRVDWPDGFGLMRSSNTTPVVVLRFEGQTPEALHRIETAMLALLHKVKPDAKIGASAH